MKNWRAASAALRRLKRRVKGKFGKPPTVDAEDVATNVVPVSPPHTAPSTSTAESTTSSDYLVIAAAIPLPRSPPPPKFVSRATRRSAVLLLSLPTELLLMVTTYLDGYEIDELRRSAPAFGARIPSPRFYCAVCQKELPWYEFAKGYSLRSDLERFCVPCGSRPLSCRKADFSSHTCDPPAEPGELVFRCGVKFVWENTAYVRCCWCKRVGRAHDYHPYRKDPGEEYLQDFAQECTKCYQYD